MDRGAWWATVHRVAQSWARLKRKACMQLVYRAEGAKDLRSIQSPGSEEACRLKYPQICLQLFAIRRPFTHTTQKGL